MATLSEIFSSSVLAAILIKLLDFCFSCFKKRDAANVDVLVHTKKIFFSKRMDCIENIFCAIDRSAHAINTNQKVTSVNKIIEVVSRSKMPRTIYLSQSENKLVDDILDEIKIQSCAHTSFNELDVKVEGLRKCLGIDFVK